MNAFAALLYATDETRPRINQNQRSRTRWRRVGSNTGSFSLYEASSARPIRDIPLRRDPWPRLSGTDRRFWILASRWCD